MTDVRNPIELVIIDDNPRSVEYISTALASASVKIFTASDPEEGLDLVYTHRPQVVMTDLVMPRMSGLEVLERITEFDPAIDVILMTAHYTTETAVEAIRKGAADYLNKPIELAVLRDRVGRIIDAALVRQQVRHAEDQVMETAQFEGIVGRSPEMWEMFSRIRRIAPHYRAALITGQTGTGKELVAQALHRLSLVKGRFVVLNCSAVVETLFESELFGHVRGAFTGAERDKTGLFEHARGGTLFLDEIGDMPLSTQAKLLRVLQNQEVLRVGSLTPQKVDVRVVAATNKDLRRQIAERQFREDLYFRLSMVEIQTPSLAQRMGDLPLLARSFVKKFSRQYNKNISGITQRAQILLGRHTWPGNVRELENVIGHGCMMTMTSMIDVADLPLLAPHAAGAAAAVPLPQATITAEPANASLEEHEKQLVMDALNQAAGNQSQAARQLRIGRDALRYKMKKFGLL
ncbi:MAG TPA: sigma-54 dependent transcriptional regulator [Candidatus Dormibacteraeota bacterium]|nr:sigma-54 dependent transcriptional regulator [Candidatus Dormibacteraeota bacterium]